MIFLYVFLNEERLKLVKYLINEGTGMWRVKWFLKDIVVDIIIIPFLNLDEEDIIIWRNIFNGEYIIKSGYAYFQSKQLF